jgi:hypothetical protein
VKLLALLILIASSPIALADFSGTPITLKTNGGWSWFQDPRAIIDNGQILIGSVAGTTTAGGSGFNAGDINLTTYSLSTQAASNTVLHAALEQDDHDVPAIVALPDGRYMAIYQKHGGDNLVRWRTSTITGSTAGWNAEATGTANPASDGNGNTYANPFYLSVPNKLYSFSRSIGYDPNYSVFTSLTNTNPTYAYGGHWMYWKNPNTGPLTGGNGRPYVKFASNGTDTVWFANTEDSPDNYDNSLYVGYMKFDAAGNGTVYTSTGTLLGNISTATAPTGGSNPPSTGNAGDITSGTGKSYLPTDFTPVLQSNVSANNMTGKAVSWASSMRLDSFGNPYIGIVVRDNLNDAVGNDLEYYFAHFNGSSCQVSRMGYAGNPLYSGQPNYAGLITLDPYDPNKAYISANVDPSTDAPLGHYQIFEGTSSDNGATWDWTQLTSSTSVDNVRPIIAYGDDNQLGSDAEALLWMQGTYTSYTNYNTNIVGLVQTVIVPEPAGAWMALVSLTLLARRHRGR